MSATATADQFSAVLDKAQHLLGRLERMSGEVVSAVESKANALPGVIADKVIWTLEQSIKPYNDGLQLIRNYLSHPGDADALRKASEAWNSEVGGVASDLAATISTQFLKADDAWEGKAAYTYKQTIPGQQEALKSIKTITDALMDALTELASAVTSFMSAIAIATGTLAAATGTLIMAGLASLPGLVVWFLSCATAVFASLSSAGEQLSSFAKTVRTQMAALKKQLENNATFPNGEWPKQTTDLSDGITPL
ncbi:hypothetical protein ACH347_31025 [Saccharopolyspora sp. 5N102]|uniref:hypothetical protein n=1 Tax=Saccharopolyspora sp. 5N102 TaxID=3375155 RepID=UPI0037924E33